MCEIGKPLEIIDVEPLKPSRTPAPPAGTAHGGARDRRSSGRGDGRQRQSNDCWTMFSRTCWRPLTVGAQPSSR